MGEKQNGPFQLSFNASIKVDFQGSRVTSDDAGRTRNFRRRSSCATPPTAASRAMRMSTMPREPRKIRRSG